MAGMLCGEISHPLLIFRAILKKALDAYISYCTENGNKQTTIRYKQWICGRFLKNLVELNCKRTTDISGEQVQSAFLQLGFSRYWERIGPFLRFLFENGFVDRDYSKLIQHRKKTLRIQRCTLQMKLPWSRIP